MRTHIRALLCRDLKQEPIFMDGHGHLFRSFFRPVTAGWATANIPALALAELVHDHPGDNVWQDAARLARQAEIDGSRNWSKPKGSWARQSPWDNSSCRPYAGRH